MPNSTEKRTKWIPVAAPAFVAVASFAVFLQALAGDFVSFDDKFNFLDNPHFRGLGPAQLAWMWSDLNGHYQPLTWMSHGLDYLLFGMDPYGYHVVNVLLHVANALLAYAIFLELLRRAQRFHSVRRSDVLRLAAAFGALLFAIHPLRVEAVAWITERRAVLFLFFALLSIVFYLRSNRRGVAGAARHRLIAVSVLCFAAMANAALASKPRRSPRSAFLSVANISNPNQIKLASLKSRNSILRTSPRALLWWHSFDLIRFYRRFRNHINHRPKILESRYFQQ